MKKILIILITVFLVTSLSASLGSSLGGGGSFTKTWLKLTGDANDIALYLNNDQWIAGRNNADSAWLNMFKMNTSDQIEVGSEILMGTTFFGDSPGVAVANYYTVGTDTDTHGLVLAQANGVNLITAQVDGDASGGVTDELVTIDGDLTVTGSISGTSSCYGELYIANNSTSITVNSSDQWQAVSTLILEGETEGFTYEAGTSGTDISAYADSSGTHTTITTTGAHALSIGDYITIDGTTNYNGVMKVTSSADNTHFVVEWVYIADDATGNYNRGVSLTADTGSAGMYSGQWNSGGQSADANQVFHFTPCKNTTIAAKALAPRKFTNTDDGSFSGGALVDFSDGDKIFFLIRNKTSAGNVTLLTLDMRLVKIQ